VAGLSLPTSSQQFKIQNWSSNLRTSISASETQHQKIAIGEIVFLPSKLSDRVFCMFSDVGRMEGENDFIFGYSSGHQCLGNAVFRAVKMNPNLIIFYLNVNETVVNVLFGIPPLLKISVYLGKEPKVIPSIQVHGVTSLN